MHDHAGSTKTGIYNGHVMYAWLFPHATKDPRGIPHINQEMKNFSGHAHLFATLHCCISYYFHHGEGNVGRSIKCPYHYVNASSITVHKYHLSLFYVSYLRQGDQWEVASWLSHVYLERHCIDFGLCEDVWVLASVRRSHLVEPRSCPYHDLMRTASCCHGRRLFFEGQDDMN